jgi:hypothetical protein
MKPNPLWLNLLLWFACGLNLYCAYRAKKAQDEMNKLCLELDKELRKWLEPTKTKVMDMKLDLKDRN